MFIGFLLAALSVMGVYTRGAEVPVLAVFTPVCLLGLPLLDTLSVIVLRWRARHPPWVGDRRHLSHRLVRRGMQPATAVATLWVVSLACGATAVLLPMVGAAKAPLLLAIVICVLAAVTVAAGSEGLP
jgi:UDP-GlcNAc:undecaprenyl-phosphate GlcNAc-1-phosphate transferase